MHLQKISRSFLFATTLVLAGACGDNSVGTEVDTCEDCLPGDGFEFVRAVELCDRAFTSAPESEDSYQNWGLCLQDANNAVIENGRVVPTHRTGDAADALDDLRFERGCDIMISLYSGTQADYFACVAETERDISNLIINYTVSNPELSESVIDEQPGCYKAAISAGSDAVLAECIIGSVRSLAGEFANTAAAPEGKTDIFDGVSLPSEVETSMDGAGELCLILNGDFAELCAGDAANNLSRRISIAFERARF